MLGPHIICLKVPVEGEEGEGQNELPISNTQTIREIILKEKGDIEAWRCVLPSGTVVRYKQNGDAQVNVPIPSVRSNILNKK